VYQFCDANDIAHNFNTEKKCAGKKWLQLFLARHNELSVRKPEGTSMQREIGYNSTKIHIFEQVLKKELFTEDGHRRIAAENNFNVDETGLTVNQKPRKVIAKRGKKSMSVMSVEKGKTITAVCCVSAAGVYCPLFLVFPRKRFKLECWIEDQWVLWEWLIRPAGLMRQHFHNGSIIFSTLFILAS